MEINKLSINFLDKNNKLQTELFENKVEYLFGKKTLITSNLKNSRGKTSLVRFLLYSLGYKIPHTDGINIYNFKTTVHIKHKRKSYKLTRINDAQYINDKIFRNPYEETYIPMINLILGVDSIYLSEALLGTFYIDQEKGWTLINRGSIIGKLNFNIEKFFLDIENKTDLEYLVEENSLIKNRNEEIKKIDSLINAKYERVPIDDEEEIDLYNNILELENEKMIIKQNLFSNSKDIKKFNNIISNNKTFSQEVEKMNLVISHKGEDIVVNKKNLKSFDFNNKILEMKKRELEFENNILRKKLDSIEYKIKSIRKQNISLISYEPLNKFLAKLKKEIQPIDLDSLKWKNKNKFKENNEIILEHIDSPLKYFWKILEPILRDIGISENYISEKIILRRTFSGMSGTQRHKLSLAYKMALNIYIKEKLNIYLPFIIDSPLSGEVTEDVVLDMLNLCKKYLSKNQLIVSSVINLEKEFHFSEKIILNNGVLNEIDKFKINLPKI